MSDAPSYDFIIVGGGTSGLVIANRLTEDPAINVLVLEAGLDHSADPRVITPALYHSLFGTELDWGSTSVPQSGLNDRCIPINQGRALGGSSTINAQVFAPPTKTLINSWEEFGNEDWNWASMQPYYAKTFSLPKINPESEALLGVDGWTSRPDADAYTGPVKLSFPGDASHPIRQAWGEAFKALGHALDDVSILNSSSTGGFSCLTSIDPATSQRISSVSAYYQPASHRSNLHLLTGAAVERVMFVEPPPYGRLKASGVQYIQGGDTKTALCTKEVILTAGTFHSPKVLELSGIGNPQLLKKHEIENIVDLPGVGENLQDHLVCGVDFEVLDDVETLDGLVRQEPEALSKAMEDFATTQSGWFTSMGLWGCAYLPVIKYLSDAGRESLKALLSQHRPAGTDGNAAAGDRFDIVGKGLLNPKHPDAMHIVILCQNTFPINDKPAVPVPGKFITLGTVLSQPVSTGTVHIRDAKSTSDPVIDPRYLSNTVDADVFGHNLLWLKELAASTAFSHLLKQPVRHSDPNFDLSDLDAAKSVARSRTISMWHPVGTCAMAAREKGGVVDSKLRVYGVDGLRVADASIMPLITTGNTQSTVYAVAERAADLIKAAWA